MAAPSDFGDPTVIPSLVANHIVTTANDFASANSLPNITVKAEDLTNAISEVTPDTEVLGAALLTVALNDPDRSIRRSGICNQTSDGLLYQVDVNYPEGTPVWWRLAMVDWNDSDPSVPDLTLTFQHRPVSYLADCWGPLGWPAGAAGTTRAQFIKMLADRMPLEIPKQSVGPGPKPGLTFICPQVNEIQPIAGATSFGTQILTKGQQQSLGARLNKTSGVTPGTKFTVFGQKPTNTQLRAINDLLGVGVALNAPTAAMVAIIYAAMGESHIDPSAPGGGILQGTSFPNPGDVAGEANAFFKGTNGFGNGGFGGALAAAKKGLPAWEIANSVEDNAVWAASHGDSYAHQWPGGQSEGIAEATAIVNAHSGGGLLSGLAGLTGSTQSDVSQLTRGTASNPDEDSWTCMQRLASEVNWKLFTSPCAGFAHGQQMWGNYLYYIDGPTLVAQQPALYLELGDDGVTWKATDPHTGKTVAADGVVTSSSGTIDNTAFMYQETRKLKGRTQRRTGIRTPQTPSRQMFTMICGVLEFNAGDVFVFHDTGPENGRWIVEDVTHNSLADIFAQFTLGPPTYPYPEPQATKTGNSSPTSSNSVSKDFTGVAQAAKLALSQQIKSGRTLYSYSQGSDRGNNGTLFGPAPRTMDCSAFATLCYKAAGLPDPNHLGYSPIGFTGSFITHCKKISAGDAQPGDLCFFGSSEAATTHMNVYIGNGQSISMGTQGDPSQGPAAQMGPSGFLGYYRSDVVSAGAAQAGKALGNAGSKLTGAFGGLF